MKHYRQGDLLIQEISSFPEGVTPQTSTILVRGESTGHAHRILGAEVFQKNGALFFKVSSKVQLVHDEHKLIVFGKGLYSVLRQREYVSSDMTKIVTD